MDPRLLRPLERVGVPAPRLAIKDAGQLTDKDFDAIDALCAGTFWKASQHPHMARGMVEPGTEVVLFRDVQDSLVGLTMFVVDRVEVEGRQELAFSVLDTYIKPALRHHELAAMAFAVCSERELRHNRGRAVYAVIPAGTYHGYELVTHTLAHFYPRPGQEPPPRERAILHAVAERRFGNIWDPARGVLVHPQNLVSGVVEIPPERLADPVVAFFAERNPGYLGGDVLMCIARISWDVPLRNLIRWAASRGHAMGAPVLHHASTASKVSPPRP